jgi:hypothetical protein
MTPDPAGRPKVDPRVQSTVQMFGELIKDRAFRGSLDALSADVLELCADFFEEHAALIATHGRNVEPDDIISAVCGWILGMPAGQSPADHRVDAAFQHNAIAAFVSAWSAENSSRIWRRN